jgi:Flp pilus assembly protein TadG
MMLSRLLKIARDRDGASLVEFAIVLPLLTIVLLGVTQFGIFFYDYVTLENAAVLGERNFLQQRPFYNTAAGCSSSICPTSCFTPYSSTVSLIQTATAGLQASDVTTTLSVAGTACTSDSTCGNALCTAYLTTGAYSTAQTASVTVSYPCLTLLPTYLVPGNFCPGGVLTSKATRRVD